MVLNCMPSCVGLGVREQASIFTNANLTGYMQRKAFYSLQCSTQGEQHMYVCIDNNFSADVKMKRLSSTLQITYSRALHLQFTSASISLVITEKSSIVLLKIFRTKSRHIFAISAVTHKYPVSCLSIHFQSFSISTVLYISLFHALMSFFHFPFSTVSFDNY